MSGAGQNPLAELIRRRREELRIDTAAEMLRRAGLQRHVLQTIGDGNEPRLSTLQALATALELPLIVVVYAALGHKVVPAEEMPAPVEGRPPAQSRIVDPDLRQSVTAAAEMAWEQVVNRDLRPSGKQFGRVAAAFFDVLYGGDAEDGDKASPVDAIEH